MKFYIKTLIAASALTAMLAPALAQTDTQRRMTREQLAETQANYIADETQMDDDIVPIFVETYCNYQKEIWKLGPRPQRHSAPEATEEETEQALKYRFEHSQKILDIRRKYYTEYCKFLTQKQIEQVYELEKKIMTRLANRSKMKGRQQAAH